MTEHTILTCDNEACTEEADERAAQNWYRVEIKGVEVRHVSEGPDQYPKDFCQIDCLIEEMNRA